MGARRSKDWGSGVVAVFLIVAVGLVGTVSNARPTAASASPAGSLAGIVTFGPVPVAGINVWLYRSLDGQWTGATTTDTSGAYRFPSLAPGTYRIQGWSASGSVPRYSTTWFPAADTFATATDVVVAGGAATASDLNLARTGTVTGRVTDGGSGLPLAGVAAMLSPTNGGRMSAVTTDGNGRYTFSGVVPAVYQLGFDDPSGAHPAGGIWADQAELIDATPIVVVAGFVQNADQRLYSAADQPAPAYSGNPAGPTVAVIGDSITQTSTHEIHDLVDPIANASVRGISGQRVDQMQAVAQKMAAMAPSQVIIALGTNDELQGWPLTRTEAAIQAMVALFPSTTCLHVVTVADRSSSPAFNADVDALNVWLRGLPAVDARIDVVDWQHAYERYVGNGSPNGPWLSDEIHPSAPGQYALAALMRDAIGSCGRPLSTVSGSVFNDHGADGLRDAGDEALVGVRFELHGDDLLGNAVTVGAVSGADGFFTLTGFRGGTYDVDESVPSGFGFPRVAIGLPPGIRTVVGATAVTLGAGVSASGYEWAQPPWPSSVGGTVFADLDGDGVREVGEPGLGGITLRLGGADGYGETVTVATTTDAAGSWVIPSLNPGVYTITEQGPNGFTAGRVQTGSFGGTASPRSVSGLAVPAAQSTRGYDFAERPVPASQWAVSATGPSAVSAKSVALDGYDNAYVVGGYVGAATFGTGPSSISVAATGTSAAYLARYGPDGTPAWVAAITATGWAELQKVTVDAGGNIDVTGNFDGTVTLGSGATVATLTGPQDGLIASFTANGELRWARALAGELRAIGMSVTADQRGAIFAVGAFSRSMTVESGVGIAPTVLEGTDGLNGYAVSFDTNGALRWARVLPSALGLIAFDVAPDGSGGAVIVGSHAGFAFDAAHTATGSGSADVFVAAVDGGGAVRWARTFGGPGIDLGLGVAVDSGTGSVFVSGSFGSTVEFGAGMALTSRGAGDAFVVALDAGGTTQWVQQAGGGSTDLAIRVTTGAGHVHVAGVSTGPTSFGPVSLIGVGSGDGFVASYDLAGRVEWVRPIAGVGWDTAWEAATAPNGDAVAVGGFSSVAAVMPGPLERPLLGGGSSQFITRLNA